MNFFSKDKKSKSDLLKKKRAANGYGVGGKGKTLGGKATPGKFVSPLIFAEAGPLGMSIEENDAKNAVIASTVPGGMAESIGILRGDVICWSGSGSSGDDHDPPDPPTFHEFMAVVKEGSRPLEIGVLRIELSTKKGDRDQNTNTNTNTVSSSSSATAEMRKKQMVAAAEQRQSSLNKNFKTKTGPKQGMGSVARVNTNLTVNHLTGAEFGEETKRAVEKIKQKERASAKELGYNPYDTVKKSTGSGAMQMQMPMQTQNEDDKLDDFAQSVLDSLAVLRAGDVESKTAISTIAKLLENATSNEKGQREGGDKFLNIKVDNEAIQKRVLRVEGAAEFLLVCGFVLGDNEHGETVMTFPRPLNSEQDWIRRKGIGLMKEVAESLMNVE
ncbi:hypothetical protein ScalyP_jg8016 [Parmales sp. scaly parma]|nr:hypothetical protein ScalyP_jg8016 [Parmales sp. scaly parma]